jgi:hypothetical protein
MTNLPPMEVPLFGSGTCRSSLSLFGHTAKFPKRKLTEREKELQSAYMRDINSGRITSYGQRIALPGAE